MTKKWVVAWMLCMTAASYAKSLEKFELSTDCEEGPEACISIVGDKSEAWAKIGKVLFKATGKEATCCQLASDIHQQACNKGKNPKWAVVTCR